jgi:EAL domain-containing protein (putative c-di-GMP-specific phosphodiesterase class I)
LDRSFLARIDASARSASIARATIRLCSELGLHLTAGGVERLEQFAALSDCRGMKLQGFLMSEPVSREKLMPLIKTLPGVVCRPRSSLAIHRTPQSECRAR